MRYLERMTDSPRIEIVQAPRERWGSALNLVLSQRPVAERMQLAEALANHRLGHAKGAGFQGLLEARVGGQTVGAALAVLQSGRTALTYQPRITATAPAGTRELLHQAILQFLNQHGVCLAQEVLPLDALADADRAKALGYTIEVELLYMAAELVPSTIRRPTQTPVDLSLYAPASEQRLAALLNRSFEQTLDCPEVNGVRSSIESLQSYAETGTSGTSLWGILRHEDSDIGCVLVAQHASQSAELVYLGLIPEVRGRGWSRHAIGWANWLAASANCAAISVAVDRRNTPAIKAYHSSGFEQFDARRVMLRILTADTGQDQYKTPETQC